MTLTSSLYVNLDELLKGLATRTVAILHGQVLTALIFSLKAFGAALLALYVAFWLGLDQPKWALMTVFIVSQPDSGLVLAKSFFRLLGTIAGTLVSMALVFAFSQHGELFLASIAAWIGICNFAARAAGNFTSYGFLLSGYTTAVIGIPAALNPSGAYPLILERFSEVSIGIVCAALVSRVILPHELTPQVLAQARALARRVERFAAVIVNSTQDRAHVAATLVDNANYVQMMRKCMKRLGHNHLWVISRVPENFSLLHVLGRKLLMRPNWLTAPKRSR